MPPDQVSLNVDRPMVDAVHVVRIEMWMHVCFEIPLRGVRDGLVIWTEGRLWMRTKGLLS